MSDQASESALESILKITMFYYLAALLFLAYTVLEISESSKRRRLQKRRTKQDKSLSPSVEEVVVDPAQLSVRLLRENPIVEKVVLLSEVAVVTKDLGARVDALAKVEVTEDATTECYQEIEDVLRWLLKYESTAVTSYELLMYPNRLAERILDAFNSKEQLKPPTHTQVVDLRLLSYALR